MKAETIVVVAGGHPSGIPCPRCPRGGFVIAADGGVDRALALGLHVDVAIGDFDSVTPAGLAAVEAAGARIERHPAAKDATDLELALDAALALAPSRILVIGSSGGRLDHLLGSLLLLGDERYAGVDARRPARCERRPTSSAATRTLAGAPGELLSLLPAARRRRRASRRKGLEYPLHGETLPAGTSRGISNVFSAAEARITVARGCLLAVRPGPEDEESL